MRKKMTLTNENSDKTFKDGFKEFLLNCKIKNLSPFTITYYENVVRIWKRYFDEDNLLCDITLNTINDFILFLKDEMEENDTTINTNITGIRAILYYLMKLGYLEKFAIPKIKADKEIIETYSEKEIGVLLKKPKLKECTFNEYRNWVIINFLLATGCRTRTLVNIRINDLDFDNQLITYTHTKNRKQQIVPMSITLKKVLAEYIEYRKADKQDDLLFVNAYGEQLRTPVLSSSLCEYNRKRGILKTGVHRWRHTFAKLWILGEGDIFRLQKILGHSDLEIIKNYVDMFTNDLQKDFDRFNPLEQMKDNKKFINMGKAI